MKYTDPVYGEVEFNGLEEKIIKNPGMQRLKKIHSSGAAFLVNLNADVTRFEHSLGVGALCKKLGNTEEEAIAGLVHDIPHTVFSHLIDQVYERKDQTFHEDHHQKLIERYRLDELVEEHGYNPDHVLHEDNFTVLEKDLPDLCADRVDYTLRDLYHYNVIDKEEAQGIINRLTVENGTLVTENRETAKEIVNLSIKLNKKFFFSKKSEAADMLMKEILLKALDKGTITEEDFFKTDEYVIKEIKKDEGLSRKLEKINKKMKIKKEADHDKYKAMRKHRVVDPLVKGTGNRISEIDKEIKEKLREFKEQVPKEVKYEIKTTKT